MISIKKSMQAKLPKDKVWQNAIFLKTLKSMTAAGDLVQVKNSYKLSADFKKKVTKSSTSTTTKKAAAPKKATTAKKTTTTKKVRYGDEWY